MSRIALFGRQFSEEHNDSITQFLSILKERKVVFSVYTPFLNFLDENLTIERSQFAEYDKENFDATAFDVMISVGGDGTMLECATLICDSELPILGLNTGRLGFLSSISLEHMREAIDQIVSGAFMTDHRSLIKLETEQGIFGKENFALNELTVHKKDTQSMIVIHAYVDGKFLNTYWADGLIIATPTGSTAYSLSCGGPIILPSSSNFIITPVAPHNLNVRPVLISDQSTVTLRVEGRSENFLISLDSRSATIEAQTVLTLSKHSFGVNLIRLKNHSFLKTLRNKLNWGLDKRN
ncbi:MAG TPA: NAD kinase [Flavobacteriales bacterium]|mgnify:FL=1|jgi:NAD+ kinase|nr:NAD kinase [Flavobacteriales bacterium]HAW19866.1 NAD kinase [Flavobacteriales bacterium]